MTFFTNGWKRISDFDFLHCDVNRWIIYGNLLFINYSAFLSGRKKKLCHTFVVFQLELVSAEFFFSSPNNLQFDSDQTIYNKNINQNTITESHFELKTNDTFCSPTLFGLNRILREMIKTYSICELKSTQNKTTFSSYTDIWSCVSRQRQNFVVTVAIHTLRIHTLPSLNWIGTAIAIVTVHTERTRLCVQTDPCRNECCGATKKKFNLK